MSHRRIRPNLCLLVAATLALGNCSKPPQATTTSDTNLPVPAISLLLSTAPILAPQDFAAVHADFVLSDPEVVSAPIVFGSFSKSHAGITPVILRKANTHWRIVDLPAMQGAQWVYAGTAISRGELWALLYSTTNARPMGIYLLCSKDDGQSWAAFSAVKLPASTVEFLSFSIKVRGDASITVHQEDDSAAVPRGLYAYHSSDGAKTWSAAAFEADDLIAADQPAASFQDAIDSIHPATRASSSPTILRRGTTSP